ncbi:MAG: GNAT family N-acetyltransferase [Defluviitaleaceae bacterium]|nr:GNAT family N-acetyltransferase [Defluviitaleaceae bacterium]MCL2276040.1 GNAT family N-acetyltransferase [Defluviitaleaceae bacterium]
MEFAKVTDLPFDARPQVSAIFTEGFYEGGFKHIDRDKAVIARALAHMFILDHFYAAIEGEEILAFIAITDKKPPPIRLDKALLRRELGFIRGSIVHWALVKQLINRPYPFTVTQDMGSVEFVATAPNHRGKGIAKALLSHVMEERQLPYTKYVLEVIDNNSSAIKLYENLGFKEFTRTKAPSRFLDFKYLLYMKRSA